MDLSNDRLSIDTSHRDAQGKQIDPEEKPAERVLDAEIPITVGGGAAGVGAKSASEFTNGAVGDRLIHKPTVNVAGTALEFAHGHSHRCCLCKNYNNHRFLEWKHRMMLSPNLRERAEVDFLRSKIFDGTVSAPEAADGLPDVEWMLNTFAICDALSSIFKEEHIVTPESGCPDYRGEATVKPELQLDFQNLFEPKDADAARISNASYDNILKTAQGAPAPRRAERVKVDLSKYFTPKPPKENP
ncbi:MAG: hypothetical protein WC729_29400 [Sphingomonas sp.]|jgi:hypothetical protein|uniref:hypothetical protein n=1 Tax=Sphingomonas sp. TaxID=28214 RepID=UPI0035688EF6